MNTMPTVDYFREAFGHFDPARDHDAALKVALGLLMMDGKVEALLSLLTPNPHVGAIGGDPGWEIERRNPSPPVPTAYAGWPDWATFRAYIDPDGFRLEHPESFYDARTFAGYVWVAAAVYGRHHPDRMPLVASLLDVLPKRTIAAGTAVV